MTGRGIHSALSRRWTCFSLSWLPVSSCNLLKTNSIPCRLPGRDVPELFNAWKTVRVVNGRGGCYQSNTHTRIQNLKGDGCAS